MSNCQAGDAAKSRKWKRPAMLDAIDLAAGNDGSGVARWARRAHAAQARANWVNSDDDLREANEYHHQCKEGVAGIAATSLVDVQVKLALLVRALAENGGDDNLPLAASALADLLLLPLGEPPSV